MKLIKLSGTSKWAWSFRITGLLGQAFGTAESREEALHQCIKRLKEEGHTCLHKHLCGQTTGGRGLLH